MESSIASGTILKIGRLHYVPAISYRVSRYYIWCRKAESEDQAQHRTKRKPRSNRPVEREIKLKASVDRPDDRLTSEQRTEKETNPPVERPVDRIEDRSRSESSIS